MSVWLAGEAVAEAAGKPGEEEAPLRCDICSRTPKETWSWVWLGVLVGVLTSHFLQHRHPATESID